MIRFATALAACLVGAATDVRAQDAPLSWGHAVPVRPADAAAIQAVIKGQLDAFARGDPSAAYAVAAPNVRRKFPTAADFAAMARSNYEPLFKAERKVFSSPRGGAATETQAETWSQSLEISTRDGERWTASYGLERQPDGSIAITSCVLVRHTDSSS